MKTYLTLFSILCLILTVSTFNLHARNINPTDLVIYYSFNEDTLVGGDVIDESGNGNDGVIRGPLKIVEGKVNECMEFPGGAANYISVRNVHYVEGIPELTIAVWIKTAERGLIASWDRSEYFRFAAGDDVLDNTTFVAFDMCCNPLSDWHGNIVVTDDQWHHVAVTFNAEAKKIYVDGKIDVEQDPLQEVIGPRALRYGFIGVGSEATEFDGSRGPTWNFKGLMDEFLMFHRVLSEKEIQTLAEGVEKPFSIDPKDKLSVMWGNIKNE